MYIGIQKKIDDLLNFYTISMSRDKPVHCSACEGVSCWLRQSAE